MGKYENKSMEGKAEVITAVKCVRECWIPFVGSFTVGQIISGKDFVEVLQHNPNFEAVKEA